MLNVYCKGIFAGKLDMAEGEPFYGFTYDADYLQLSSAEPLSLSLPLREERFSGSAAMPFFEGLLPEGDARVSIARQLGISSTSPAKLSALLGRTVRATFPFWKKTTPISLPRTIAMSRSREGWMDLRRTHMRRKKLHHSC